MLVDSKFILNYHIILVGINRYDDSLELVPQNKLLTRPNILLCSSLKFINRKDYIFITPPLQSNIDQLFFFSDYLNFFTTIFLRHFTVCAFPLQDALMKTLTQIQTTHRLTSQISTKHSTLFYFLSSSLI